MPFYHLIETRLREQMLVLDLAGHEDCRVLDSGVTRPRVAGCERINGRWRIDKDAARRAKRLSELASPHNALSVIEQLEARLAALEARNKIE